MVNCVKDVEQIVSGVTGDALDLLNVFIKAFHFVLRAPPRITHICLLICESNHERERELPMMHANKDVWDTQIIVRLRLSILSEVVRVTMMSESFI